MLDSWDGRPRVTLSQATECGFLDFRPKTARATVPHSSIVVGILGRIGWEKLRILNVRVVSVMADESDDLRRLMEAVVKGDGDALASLFSMYRERLHRMVELRLDARLRGRVSPSDILQEAYIGALTRLPHYQASADVPFFVWLRSVTMQRLIDAHRRHLGGQARDVSREIRLGQVEAIEAGSGQIAELVANTTSPSLAARRGEIMALVRDALEQLDAIDREVLVLRHFEQMSNNEAAAALAIKPAAASKRYVRAVERLKTVMEQISGLEGGYT
jgi:RNA polymerase sigma-70 factor, ECF subfamily